MLTQAGGGQAAVMEGAALAERHHFLRDGAGGLGLGQRGRDAPVLDQAANQVRQHRVAMFELCGPVWPFV